MSRKVPFRGFKPEDIIRKSLNGIDDPEQSSFAITSRAGLSKDSHNVAEAEYIDAYLRALLILAAGNSIENATEIALARSFSGSASVAMPCLFLCRHLVELCLKSTIEKSGKATPKIHALTDLWKDAAPIVKKACGEQFQKGLWKFVKFVDGYDPKGTAYRYPVEDYSSVTAEADIQSPLWLNTQQLYRSADLFVRTLRENHLIPENQFSKLNPIHTPLGTVFVDNSTRK